MVNTITTSLAVLKEGSAVASRIPYIGAIAGLLLQALEMQDVGSRSIYSPRHGFIEMVYVRRLSSVRQSGDQ